MSGSPGHSFARTNGRCIHASDCRIVNLRDDEHGRPYHWTVSRAEAEAYLRQSHDHRRCSICAPDLAEPDWVRTRIGNRDRWIFT